MEERGNRMEAYLSSPYRIFQGCFRAILISCRWILTAGMDVNPGD